MAISDVLSQASADIKSSLKDFPSWYSEYEDRLKKLLAEMDAIRIELDTPPTRKRA